jgi:O-antigen ligase
MTTGATTLGGRSAARPADRAFPVLAALASLPVGCALALALYQVPPPLALAVAGGLGLVAVLALTLAHNHAAVALGLALLAVQAVDPAPSDGVFLVVMGVAFATGRYRLRSAPRPVIAILAIFAALNVMAAVQVADVERAVLFFAITFYLALLGLWLPGYVVSRARARLVVRGYLFAAVTSACVGVLALLGALPAHDLLTESDRARALFQDPNVFGPFLIPAVLILVEEVVAPRILSARLATKAVLLGILLLGVLFSYSRGAWLNLGLGLLVLGVVLSLRGGSRTALALVAVGASTAAIVGAVVVATGSGDFLAERARPQTYDTQRFSGQRAGLRPAQEYPFGAGPGQFESVAGISAHSTYARALGEEGFVGLLTLLAFLGYTLLTAVRNAMRGRGTYGIGSAALLAAWCGLLANSAFIDTLHWRHLWLVAALVWAGAMRQAAAADSHRPGGS